VGKRSGKHSKKQVEICKLITEYARRGKAVIRLKGGDVGIFGRLAEEIEVLDQLSLPYYVIPGISSLQSASGGTGLLLTRRGTSRGFSVMTPRKEGSAEYLAITPEENLKFPRVYFMGKSVISQITTDLLAEGWDKNEAAAVLFAAGTDEELILTGNLANIADKVHACNDDNQPGIVIVGANADKKYLYNQHGAMAQKKILITCSETLQEKTSREIRKFGGKPINMPMIKLLSLPSVSQSPVDFCRKTEVGSLTKIMENFDYCLFTSPTAVKIFLTETDIDVRILPKIMVCGLGTACEFSKIAITPDLIAEDDFGAAGLIKAAKKKLPMGTKILRFCSDKASAKLSCELRRLGFEIEDKILYHNIPQYYDKLPDFTAAIFASSSAVNTFIENFGKESLKGKVSAVIGQPTLATLKQNAADHEIVIAREATMLRTVNALAEYFVNRKLAKDSNNKFANCADFVSSL